MHFSEIGCVNGKKKVSAFVLCFIFMRVQVILLFYLWYIAKYKAFPHTYTYTEIYTHTHTHKYIYMYMHICGRCPFFHILHLLALLFILKFFFFSSSQTTTTNRPDVVGVEREIWVSDKRADERKKKSSLAIIIHR